MPALVLIGAWEQFDWLLTTLIAFAGGMLGILFMIPMRRVFITGQHKSLPYPEALACASVLKAGHQGDAAKNGSAASIFYGTLVGAIFKFLTSFVGLMRGTVEGAWSAFGRVFYFHGQHGPFFPLTGKRFFLFVLF